MAEGKVAQLYEDIGKSKPIYPKTNVKCVYDDDGIRLDTTISNIKDFQTNPNLIDNWYFLKPINQRGATAVENEKYGIDRWKGSGSPSGTISSSGVHIIASSTQTSRFQQRFEASRVFTGQAYTLSALLADNRLLITSGTLPETITYDSYTNLITSGNTYSDCTLRLETTPVDERLQFNIDVLTGNTLDIIACKLELGSVQTLVHSVNGTWVLNEIPDYTTEFLKCCRYFWKNTHNYTLCTGMLSSSGKDYWFTVPVPALFRTTPTVSNCSVIIRGVPKHNTTAPPTSGYSSLASSEKNINFSCNDSYTSSTVSLKYTSSSADTSLMNNTPIVVDLRYGTEFSADL